MNGNIQCKNIRTISIDYHLAHNKFKKKVNYNKNIDLQKIEMNCFTH